MGFDGGWHWGFPWGFLVPKNFCNDANRGDLQRDTNGQKRGAMQMENHSLYFSVAHKCILI